MANAGIGKGYINGNQSIDYSPNTELFKFASVVYNSKPSSTHKESLVYINIDKKYEQVSLEESTLVLSLSQILGSRPNMNVVIDSIVSIDSSKTRVLFYVNEKTATGSSRRVANQDVVSFLMQPGQQQQLTALGVSDLNVYQVLDDESVSSYLESAPPGVDPILWKTAVRDNPDPDKFIPIPIVGFEGIKQRVKLQEEESKLQTAFLNNLATRIAGLKAEHDKSVATIALYKQNILSLNNRLLKVIVQQEITRNNGLALNPTEELIKSGFENISATINNSSYNFKSKIREMLSKIKLQSSAFSSTQDRYVVDSTSLEEIRTILTMEHKAIETLLGTVNQYNKVIEVVKRDLNTIMSQQE
uniref:Probable nucleoporin Nup54 n=1 Tax=Cacopsylla melanoneura TaxID=428564 RepID=A0A8D9A9R5_9HEMI